MSRRALNILALDSAMNGCGAAFLYEGRVYARSEPMASGQAERLMPMVQAVVDESGAGYGSVDALVVTCGPGAFTGMRIGLSAARALALSLDIPLYGIGTLQALALAYAARFPEDGRGVCVVAETKRADFYVQRFDSRGVALSEPAALGVEEALAVVAGAEVVIGDAADRLLAYARENRHVIAGEYVPGFDVPDPAVMARGFDLAQVCYAENPEPVYLRGADVSMPKAPPRKLG